MKTASFFETERRYDGTQLSPHWLYKEWDLQGNALAAFTGPCEVTLDHMVDLEDVKKKAPITSPRMLHFIGEWFIDSLMEGILLQHLLVSEIYELLLEKGIKSLRRRGNDIYYRDRKFSVSIATKSLVSVLVHVGLNIQTEGTPIPTAGLAELDLDPKQFGAEVLLRFGQDYAIWHRARTKVIPR